MAALFIPLGTTGHNRLAWDLEKGDWIQVLPGDPWLRVRLKGREMNERGERPVFFDGTKFILWANAERVVEVRERGEAA